MHIFFFTDLALFNQGAQKKRQSLAAFACAAAAAALALRVFRAGLAKPSVQPSPRSAIVLPGINVSAISKKRVAFSSESHAILAVEFHCGMLHRQ